MNHQNLVAEQQALRFALGLPSEPVYLDIKPVALLTAGERSLFSERLAAVTAELGGRDDTAQFSFAP